MVRKKEATADDAPIEKQALFYERPVVLDKEKHKDYTLEPVSDYSFAKELNVVFISAPETPEVCKEYPIIFIETAEGIATVAALTVTGSGNVFINDDGKWDASYIPVFVRRYPFIIGRTDDAGKMAVLFDEAYQDFGENGNGQRLFDANGEETEFLKRIVKGLGTAHQQFQQGISFCKQIEEYDLLKSMDMTMVTQVGESRRFNLRGVRVVDEQKLRQLDDEKVMALFRTGALAWIYCHLASLGNFGRLAVRAAEKGPEHSEAA